MLLRSRHTSKHAQEFAAGFLSCSFAGAPALAERFLREATQNVSSIFRLSSMRRLKSGLFRTCVERPSLLISSRLQEILGLSVTLLYAFGHLWVGALLALLVGILDGVDGKLARLKVQTTRIGKRRTSA